MRLMMLTGLRRKNTQPASSRKIAWRVCLADCCPPWSTRGGVLLSKRRAVRGARNSVYFQRDTLPERHKAALRIGRTLRCCDVVCQLYTYGSRGWWVVGRRRRCQSIKAEILVWYTWYAAGSNDTRWYIYISGDKNRPTDYLVTDSSPYVRTFFYGIILIANRTSVTVPGLMNFLKSKNFLNKSEFYFFPSQMIQWKSPIVDKNQVFRFYTINTYIWIRTYIK